MRWLTGRRRLYWRHLWSPRYAAWRVWWSHLRPVQSFPSLRFFSIDPRSSWGLGPRWSRVNLIVKRTGYLFTDCAFKVVQVVRLRVSVFKGIGQPSSVWHHDMLHRNGLHLHVQVLTALDFRGVEGYVDHTSCSFFSNVALLCATVCW